MLYYGFILPDGTELAMDDNIRTHEELAENYIKTNNLYKDFRESSCESPVDFLVLELGAIKIGNITGPISITVAIPYHSDFIKSMCEEYYKKGFRIDKFDRRNY